MRFALALAVVLVASQLIAQQATTTKPATDQNVRKPGTAPTDPVFRPGTRDAAARTHQAGQKVMRASKVMGINVKNKANEDLGSIKDIVLDPMDGRVVYAAVSMGGFLGVGDKLFAVPWEALECREVNGEHIAYLDVDKKRMENAQGFDEEHWPDMANQQWQTENDRRYQLQRPRHEVLRPVQPGGNAPRTTQPAPQPQLQQ